MGTLRRCYDQLADLKKRRQELKEELVELEQEIKEKIEDVERWEQKAEDGENYSDGSPISNDVR